jgi:hypothetical protein
VRVNRHTDGTKNPGNTFNIIGGFLDGCELLVDIARAIVAREGYATGVAHEDEPSAGAGKAPGVRQD